MVQPNDHSFWRLPRSEGSRTGMGCNLGQATVVDRFRQTCLSSTPISDAPIHEAGDVGLDRNPGGVPPLFACVDIPAVWCGPVVRGRS